MGSHHEEVADATLGAVTEPALRTAVGRLFAEAQESVDDGRVNLVVLAARRLACLYQLLVRAGMPTIQGCAVVSDRFLDANPQRDWATTRALVLDDSVVVGTTLVRLHDELAARIGKREAVLCRAVCVDTQQSVPYLLTSIDFAALEHRSSDEVQTFSQETVAALYEHQVPFFSDFPATKPIDVTAREWKKFLQSDGWHVADVTAPLFAGNSRVALAQIPTEQTIEGFLSRVVPEAALLVDTLKIRSYVQELKTGVRVVFVPIALLAPAPPSVLDQALEAIALAIRGPEARFGLEWNEWAPAAKHRLVQLYLSACALAEMWPSIPMAMSTNPAELSAAGLESEQVSLHFGDSTRAVLAAFDAAVETYRRTPVGHYPSPVQIRIDLPPPSPLLVEDEVQEVLWEARELLADTGLPEQPSTGELTKIGLIFAHAIASVFGFVNRRYEEPQREQIIALSSRKEYDALFSDSGTRLLNQGLTMRELAAALTPDAMTGSPWTRSMVSLGIDAGNDLGIIVPVTQYDERRDIVYRCYRLGETAQLAEWPLSRGIRHEAIDALTRSVDEGFPIFTTTAPIRARWRQARRRRKGESLEALRIAVLRAVPGRINSRFEGTVTNVAEDEFEAELLTPLGDDHRIAWIPLEKLSAGERKHIDPGTRFTWSVFVEERGGVVDWTSRLRLRPAVPLDSDILHRGAATLAGLTRENDEPAR